MSYYHFRYPHRDEYDTYDEYEEAIRLWEMAESDYIDECMERKYE